MRARGRLAAVAATVVVLAMLPVLPAAGAGVGKPQISVAPDHGGVLHDGESVGVTVSIANAGSGALAPGTVRIALDKPPVVSVSTLMDRIANPGSVLLGYLVATTRSPAVEPGATARVHVNLSRAVLDGVLGSTSGTRVLGAEFAAGPLEALANSAVTRIGTGFAGQVRLGTVVPLTAPANTSGLVDPATLGTLTAPNGAWTEALRAAQADPHATVALDPEVQASIRAAGGSAPDSARAFLVSLAALPNETLQLPYADADITLERAAGAATVIAPTSFAGGGEVPAAPSPAPGASATTTPAPTPTATPVPGRADLLKWSYSPVRVGWPVPGTTTAADLAFLKTSGYPVALVSSTDVRDTRARVAAGPLARVGGAPVLVADATVSRLLTAAAADGGTAADSALATLMGVLGTDAMAGEAGSVLAVPARDQRARPGLGRVLGLVDQQRWISGTRIADLLNQASPAPVALVPGSVPAGRVAAARSAIHGETGVRHLGRAADASGPLTGPHRLGLVAVLSAAWRSDERGYPKAVATVDRAFAAFRNQVRFDQGSSITYIGGSGSLPVRVVNNLTRPVRIEVSGLASNGRLRVVGTASATIAPESLGLVKLPVRSISNGTVDVTLTLRTPDGYPIGTSSTASITVNTGWETVGAIVFVVALLALFGTGVYRNVRRARRKTRRTT